MVEEALQLVSGMKLVSQVCETQIVVVRAPAGPVDLRCGGAPMGPVPTSEPTQEIDPAFAGGSLLGKRYVDAAETLEVLCIHPGAGCLSIGGELLDLKAAKPLPTSD